MDKHRNLEIEAAEQRYKDLSNFRGTKKGREEADAAYEALQQLYRADWAKKVKAR